jgi:proline iminopeptidase
LPKYVPVKNHKIAIYQNSNRDCPTLFCLTGGPGMGCDWWFTPHLRAFADDFHMVCYDPLGSGRSDAAHDNKEYTLAYFAFEAEEIRKELGLENFHILGHSFGSMLAVEYYLTYKPKAASLILTCGAADVPHAWQVVDALKKKLGHEAYQYMDKCEKNTLLSDAKYLEYCAEFSNKHFCRVNPWPKSLIDVMATWNKNAFEPLFGKNFFCLTGEMKTWSRLKDLTKINIPVFVLTGEHDEFGIQSAIEMADNISKSQTLILKHSSHTPFFEEPDLYFSSLSAFIKKFKLLS